MGGSPDIAWNSRLVRLLILNQYALPRGAPGITRHGDLGAALAASGHDITIVASRFNYLTRRADGPARDSSGPSRTEVHSGVTFKWLNTGSYRRNDRSRIRSMLAYTAQAVIVGITQRERPDIVLASSPHLLTGVAGSVIAWRYRVPLVFEVRDLWPSILVDLGAISRGGIVHRALERLERWLYRRARLVIFVPPDGSRRLSDLGLARDKAVHVPNGTEVTPHVDLPVPASLHEILRAVAGRFVLMYAGAHGVANDLGTVVRALDDLRRTSNSLYERVAVVLIGDGSEKVLLERQIEEAGHRSIYLHPPIAKGLVSTALRHADALLVSVAPGIAHSYGLSPNKLFDYMAAGRPVLTSSHVPTIADQSGAGLRYEPGDPRDLARSIAVLVELSAAERAAMGARGRRTVERDYSVRAVAAKLERHLLRVATR